ncbi:lipocalin family protein [Sinomicrobium sp. M5D2P17]
MKKTYLCIVAGLTMLQSCTTATKEKGPSIQGTWKLVSGTTIQDKDTVHTDYTKDQEMIKIINDTHFAFLRHDLNDGKDSSAVFVAGGGKYTLKGNKYTEHLEYFNVREWEGNSFELEYEIKGDTLTTKGIEKVEALGVNHINIEKYIRVP